jgi:hypothetical protein
MWLDITVHIHNFLIQTITNLAALSVRHPKIRAAFREYLTRSNLPYRANARALHGLGKQVRRIAVSYLLLVLTLS